MEAHFKVQPLKQSRDERAAKGAQFYFTVVGANGEIQATSEAYGSEDHALRGIDDLIESIDRARSPRVMRGASEDA